MNIKKSATIIGSGFFLLDQFLKHLAVGSWSEKILLNKWLGWQPFLNNGAAFGLPVPTILIAIISILIITLFIYLLVSGQFENNNPKIFFALSLATAGALSNLIDRIFYGHTIDYILIFAGIINLADVLIVIGIAGFIYFSKYLKSDI